MADPYDLDRSPYHCHFDVIKTPEEWEKWLDEHYPQGGMVPCPVVWPFLAAEPPVQLGVPIVVTWSDLNRLRGVDNPTERSRDDQELAQDTLEIGAMSNDQIRAMLSEAGVDPDLLERGDPLLAEEVLRRVFAQAKLAEACQALEDMGARYSKLRTLYKTYKERVFGAMYGIQNGKGSDSFDLSDVPVDARNVARTEPWVTTGEEAEASLDRPYHLEGIEKGRTIPPGATITEISAVDADVAPPGTGIERILSSIPRVEIEGTAVITAPDLLAEMRKRDQALGEAIARTYDATRDEFRAAELALAVAAIKDGPATRAYYDHLEHCHKCNYDEEGCGPCDADVEGTHACNCAEGPGKGYNLRKAMEAEQAAAKASKP